MRRTVVAMCLFYSTGFVLLVVFFSRASDECAATATSDFCIPFSDGDTPPQCRQVLDFAGSRLCMRNLLFRRRMCCCCGCRLHVLRAHVLVYAMLTSDSTFFNLTKLQRILISSEILRWFLRPCVLAFAASTVSPNSKCAGL